MAVRLSEYRPFYSESLALPVDDIGETWAEVLAFSESIIAGTYLIGFSAVVSETGSVNAAGIRVTGDLASPEFINDFSTGGQSVDNNWAFNFAFPYVQVADGVLSVAIEVQKFDAAGQVDCDAANIMLLRVA